MIKTYRIYNASYCERATDNRTDCRQEVVERRPRLVVLDGDRVEVVSKPDCGNHPASVAEGDVAPVGVCVLVSNHLGPAEVFVGGRDDLHHVLVRLEPARVGFRPAAQAVERPDALLTDLLDLGAEADLVDFMGEVIAVWLHVDRVGRDMEIAGHLEKIRGF